MELQREYLRGARRKAQRVRDYFDDDDDGNEQKEERHGRGTLNPSLSGGRGAPSPPRDTSNGGADIDEVDPLDAFMMGIDAQVVREKTAATTIKAGEKPSILNQTDDHDSYMEEMARSSKKPRVERTKGAAMGGKYEDYDDDSDQEVYATAKHVDEESSALNGDPQALADARKIMEVLPPVDHSRVTYEPFRRDFYSPHAEVAALSPAEVAALRQELQVRVESVSSATAVPSPVRSFMQVGVDRTMLKVLMSLGLEAPTAIQAQAFPVALSGRDMIGIAKTGSGKTLAFTLPMVRHVMDQRELSKGEGPIAVVLSPTRELAHQIFTQARKFLVAYGAECASVYGGAGKWEQIQALKRGAEVVVATPGRLIEMIRKKHAPMSRVTFVVLDEADRMFEMGFEAQLRSIMTQIRPDRQTLMFSATFRRRIQALARDVLHDPVTLTIGRVGQANEEIHQVPVVLPNDRAKWPWLMSNLARIASEGRVLIFASSKAGCETLATNLNSASGPFASLCLHGDKSQAERSEALAKFKSGECAILVATDVAARGLDVKNVKSVVNFDVAKNIDTHVHRIGRTGRMGVEGFEPGTAYTLVTSRESSFAAQLVQSMDVARQQVPPELLALAQRDPRFSRGPITGRGSSGVRSSPQSGRAAPFPPKSTSTMDAEDAEELRRWNDAERKRKADRRQGLGFAQSVADSRGRNPLLRPSSGVSGKGSLGMFVKASSSDRPDTTISSASTGIAGVLQASSGEQSAPVSLRAIPQQLPAEQTPSIPASVRPSSPPAIPLAMPPPRPQVVVTAPSTVAKVAPPPPHVSASTMAQSVTTMQSNPSGTAVSAPETHEDGGRRRSRHRSRSASSDHRRRRSMPSSSRSRSRTRSRSRSRSRDRRRSRGRSRGRSQDRGRRRRRSRSSSRSRRRSRSQSRSRSGDRRRRRSRSRSYRRR